VVFAVLKLKQVQAKFSLKIAEKYFISARGNAKDITLWEEEKKG